MSHALIRTSPKGKGQAFIGRCMKCGAENLPMKSVHEDCPMDEVISDGQALVDILKGDAK